MADAGTLAAARARSVAAARAWHEGEAHRRIERAFAALPADDAGAAARAARALLEQADWLPALLGPLVAALADDPLFEPPLRVSRDPRRTGAVLWEGAAGRLTLSVLTAAGRPGPARVVVPGRVSVVRYLRAGGARWSLWQAERAGPAFSAAAARPCRRVGEATPADGEVRRVDGRTRGQRLEDAGGAAVTLAATLRAGAAPLSREYDTRTGALLRVAAPDDAPARTGMLLTLLRLQGRTDAGACFEAATRDPAFHLRWSAMREWLALDAAAARPRLGEMAAGDPHPEVRAAAAATLGAMPCPA